ncbi:MAG: matrixin family metalloprotease [Bacteriovoracaceae bacterium]|jgi:hypothetical protein|nr:matrixin family metalloprotease [Bacteriovoracaceae bacterium]
MFNATWKITSLLFISFLIIPANSQAFNLMKVKKCGGIGKRWAGRKPVEVKLHLPSLKSYIKSKKFTGRKAAIARAKEDIRQVIKEINSISEIDLKLELAEDVMFPVLYRGNKEKYKRSIQIGFYNKTQMDTLRKKRQNPAWANMDKKCRFSENFVTYNGKLRWAFGSPEQNGRKYWEVGRKFGNKLSFRAVLLHEVTHTLGLSHANNEYAIMNHGHKPWTSGKNEARMEFLPDDIAGLISLYGNKSKKIADLTVTNSYFLPKSADPKYKAGHHIMNKKVPASSVGGNSIQPEITINNKGSKALAFELQLWFSKNNTLDRDRDYPSRTTYQYQLKLESKKLTNSFEIPSGIPSGSYFIFAVLVPTQVGGKRGRPQRDKNEYNNTIALRGKIQLN